MKTDNKFFDEFAKMATGAVSAFAGLREQIHTEIKSQVNRFIVEMDFVPREDFEIVEAMAREARLQNEKLTARLAEIEAHLGLKKSTTVKTNTGKTKKASVKKASAKTVKKTTAKKSTAKATANKNKKKN